MGMFSLMGFYSCIMVNKTFTSASQTDFFSPEHFDLVDITDFYSLEHSYFIHILDRIHQDSHFV